MRIDDVVARGIPGYRLLDSGDGRKLEHIAGRLVVRPSPQAIWRPRLDGKRWDEAYSVCVRTADGGGRWEHRGGRPGDLTLDWRGAAGPSLRFLLRLTGFGHCGLFFEQEPLWRAAQDLVQAQAQALGRAPRVLNLFAYTGAATLAAVAAGAEVFHVDSARGVLDWGRENLRASALDGRAVRWIHDDVRDALRLSAKRGWRYDLILADPPSWGHGKGSETWRFEEEIAPLAETCLGLLDEGGDAAFVLSCHTPGVQREALRNLLPSGRVRCGDLGVAHDGDERVLPAGIYALWQRG